MFTCLFCNDLLSLGVCMLAELEWNFSSGELTYYRAAERAVDEAFFLKIGEIAAYGWLADMESGGKIVDRCALLFVKY